MPDNPAVSSTTQPPSGFYSQNLWNLIFLTLVLWAGWSCVGLVSLAPKVSLPIFIHYMWMCDCPFHVSVSPRSCASTSLPVLPVWMNVTFEIPHSWTSIQLNFLMILDDSYFCCGCAKGQAEFTYTSFLARSLTFCGKFYLMLLLFSP